MPDYEGTWEPEEYHCSICGKVFYLRCQDEGGIDFDSGTGRCDGCGKVFCADCGKWHDYEDRQGYDLTLCEDCNNDRILEDFNAWYVQFEKGYCEPKDRNCDDCPFFFKDGCMALFLKKLVDLSLHTAGVKALELDRLQKRSQTVIKNWENELQEAVEAAKTRLKK
ncbi:MAG: hypothetical protein Pg6C_17140 [Treponemataceae bacterium]|nr:MAG: hypothetical protein Pg6C_17140 [Treponemataceae bacterium]